MAIDTKTATIKSAASIFEADLKLTSTPSIDTVRRELQKRAGTVIDRKSAEQAVTDVISRKQSLEGALLGFVRGASESLEGVLREEYRIAESEERANVLYRDSLLKRGRETKARAKNKIGKSDYVVTGQVLHPVSGAPVPGVVVEAIDKDIAKHDILGVDTTDAEGRYEIVFAAKDFKESGEGLPEVVLLVGFDRRKALFVTEDVLAPRPGEPSSLNISLPDTAAGVVERLETDRQRFDTQRLLDLGQGMALNQFEHQTVQDVGSAIGGLLDRAVTLLEDRIQKGKTVEVGADVLVDVGADGLMESEPVVPEEAEPVVAAEAEPGEEVGAKTVPAKKPRRTGKAKTQTKKKSE